MKIFVTGGTGCLGGNVIDYILKETTHEVIAGVRATSDISRISQLPITIVKIDFEDIIDLFKYVPRDIDAVIHCAGNASYQKYDKEKQYIDNVVITKNLLSFFECLAHPVRFVYTSTIATRPKNINNNYAITKLQAERCVLASKLSSVILRPAVLIGKYDISNYYKMFKLIQEGKYSVTFPKKVDFCDAYEVAKAHVVAAERKTPLKEYVLGGHGLDWLNVGGRIAEMLGSKGPKYFAPKSILNMYATYGEIKNKLNYEADVTFDLLDLVYNNDLVSYREKGTAKKDLGYNHMIDIDSVLRSYIIWAKDNGYL